MAKVSNTIMKIKHLLFLLAFLPLTVSAQTVWYPTGSPTKLTPAVSTWGIKVPQLANLNCIGTDNLGNFTMGTCSGGGGGGSSLLLYNNSGNFYYAGTSTAGLVFNASSTLGNLSIKTSTTTSATTTNLYVSGNIVVPASSITNTELANSSLTVTATSPLTGGGTVSLGGSTSLGCQTASGSQAGCLSSADWTTFNNKGAGTVTGVTGTYPISVTVGAAPVVSLLDMATGTISSGTGISVTAGQKVIGTGLTITNTAPDQTVVLNNGTGISTSGTYPNFTITNTGVTSLGSVTGAIATGTVTCAGEASCGAGSYVLGNNLTITSTNAGVTSLKQTYGTAQTGALTIGTSTQTLNGITYGNTLTNSGTTFTLTPLVSGTLTVAGGGTGVGTLSSGQVLYGNGTGNVATVATGTIAQGTGITVTGTGYSLSAGVTINNAGVLSVAQTYGTAQTGAVTLATSTLSFQGLTLGNTITNSSATFTVTPTVSGTLNNAGLTNSTISGVALGSTLAALTATNGSLTFSGSYTGTAAQTVGLNVGNANTWTALQTFANASSTYLSATYASSTTYYGGLLASCNSASNALTWNAGYFGCNTITGGGGGLGWASTTAPDTTSIYSLQKNYVGDGTSTPMYLLELSTSTAPQLDISNTSGGTNAKNLIFNYTGSDLLIGTSSDTTFTSTSTALDLKPGTPAVLNIGSSTQTVSSVNGLFVQGTNGTSGSSTQSVGKWQVDFYNSAGTRSCMFVVGTTLTVIATACNP